MVDRMMINGILFYCVRNVIQMDKFDSQGRSWMITINNPTKLSYEHLEFIENKKVKFLVYQLEVGSEGTEHIQATVEFKSPIRFSTLKKVFGKSAHLEKRRGSARQAWDYCTKKETRKVGSLPYMVGKEPSKTKEVQGKLVIDMIKSNMTNVEIVNEDPALWKDVQKINELRQEINLAPYKTTLRDIRVFYLHGLTDVGKSYSVFNFDHTAYRVTDPKHPFDGYIDQKVIVFEDWSPNDYKITTMLKWLDKYPLTLPARYYSRIAAYETVFFTTNFDPKDIYRDLIISPKNRKSFFRRVQFIKVLGYNKFIYNDKVYISLENIINNKNEIFVEETSLYDHFEEPVHSCKSWVFEFVNGIRTHVCKS